jgi:hypothetical protein
VSIPGTRVQGKTSAKAKGQLVADCLVNIISLFQ